MYKSLLQLSSRQKRRRISEQLSKENKFHDMHTLLLKNDHCLNIVQETTNNLSDNELAILHEEQKLCYESNNEITVNTPQLQCEALCSIENEYSYCKNSFIPSETKETVSETFLNNLILWALEFNISQCALSSLLSLLKTVPDLKNVPNDARNLMKTPRCAMSDIIIVDDGQFSYFGFEKSLKKSILENYKTLPNNVKVNINIDGLPLSKSSGSQFWPVLGALVDFNIYIKPFVISIYHGFRKPKSSELLLQSFVDEFKIIQSKGINVNGNNIHVSINAVICDAPARAFVTEVKGHTGYFGCSKCTQEGEYIDGRMTFPETSSNLRTDQSFTKRLNIEHHLNPTHISPFEQLNIGMVTQVPLDYMHVVCIGVMKKLLSFWVNGKKDVRLKPTEIDIISERLNCLRSSITVEFARKPRKMIEYERWKASELRQFLLYTGPVVLKNILKQDNYDHFLALSVCIRILIDRNLYLKFNAYCKSLLEWFIQNFAVLYGEQHLVYNVHNLIHLPEDSKRFGPLDEFSAFIFENHLFKIKKKIRTSRGPLQQFHNRLAEENNLPVNTLRDTDFYPKLKYSKNNTKLYFKSFQLCTTKNNNYFEHVNGDIYEVIRILEEDGTVKIQCKKYTMFDNFFEYPISSKIFNIIVVKNSEDILYTISTSEVRRKCLKLPFNNDYILIPLLHNDV